MSRLFSVFRQNGITGWTLKGFHTSIHGQNIRSVYLDDVGLLGVLQHPGFQRHCRSGRFFPYGSRGEPVAKV